MHRIPRAPPAGTVLARATAPARACGAIGLLGQEHAGDDIRQAGGAGTERLGGPGWDENLMKA
ncbi:MAG: hypothetical protein PHF94_01410 [Methanothrix sp.]|nr:hypothetical protein [Methanothrix sp.]